jgi:hypothetical protein
MKKICLHILLCTLLAGLTTLKSKAQTSSSVPQVELGSPWTNDQLLEPSELVKGIKAGETKMLVLNIGAVEDIKGAKHIGAVSNIQNMEKLKSAVNGLPKNMELVIYCGCCPFVKCPNVRPAFLELKKLGFNNVKVLNIPTNLKTNWIAKGYPLAGE